MSRIEFFQNIQNITVQKLLTDRVHMYHISHIYYPAAQDRLPTEAKQGWVWSVPGWETSWEKTMLLLEEVLVWPAGGAHPVVCVGPNAPV